jgi:hypothetical protein
MSRSRSPLAHRAFASVLALGLSLAAGSATAGDAFDFECSGPAGTYADRVYLGAGMMSGRVTGWCPSSQRLVRETWETSWKRGTPRPRGPKRARVVDPVSGSTIEMVTVKQCKEPIVPIETEEQLRRIPPCVGATMTISNRIEFD